MVMSLLLNQVYISKIILRKEEYMTVSSGTYFDWYVLYLYGDGGRCVYTWERMNGLDREISNKIPNEVIESFDGMEFTSNEQIQNTKKQLKAIYELYE